MRSSSAPIALIAAMAVAGCARERPWRPPRPDGGHDVLGVYDPLSRPAMPTLSPGSFTSADECGGCHERHLAEWRTSMHRYAMVDPVFRALVYQRQRDFDGEQDQFCTQCHSAIATRGGEIVPGFSFDDLSPLALEGVTCDGCHRVSTMERDFNSGHVLSPGGPVRASIRDPMPSPAHAAAYNPLQETSRFCGGCHDVYELDGLALERPYEEWTTSPAAEQGRDCQSCHMPTYRGRATPDSPERDLHAHGFVGVDVPLSDGFVTPEELDATRARVEALLATAASMSVRAPTILRAGAQLDVEIVVRNLIDAHNLPTGSTFLRQLWIELVVEDATGATIYETGTLDSNGDLRDYFSADDPFGDPDLVSFHSNLVREDGTPEIFPWRAEEHFSRSLPPLHERTVTLFVPTEVDTPGPLTVRARLRFRSHAPFLLRALGLDELVDRLEIRQLAEGTASVELTGA